MCLVWGTGCGLVFMRTEALQSQVARSPVISIKCVSVWVLLRVPFGMILKGNNRTTAICWGGRQFDSCTNDDDLQGFISCKVNLPHPTTSLTLRIP